MSSPRAFRQAAEEQSGRAAADSNSSSPRPREENQLQQDIDAARQMSRATRGNSISQGRGPSSPVVSTATNRGAPHHHFDPAEEGDTYFHEGGPPGSPVVGRRTSAQVGSASSPLTGPGNTSPAVAIAGSQRTPGAVSRFYQHNGRRGSQSSIDSEQHFIDHRHQQHSLSTSVYQRSFQPTSNMRSPNTFMRRRDTGEESALIDDDEDDLGNRSSTREGDAARNAQGDRFNLGPASAQHDDVMPISPQTASRRPSMLEDDVCFPPPQAALDEHQQHVADIYPDDAGHHHHHHDTSNRMVDDGCELPLGYPFNFDLQALEDFAGEEKGRIGQSSSYGGKPGAGGLRHRAGTAAKNARQLSVASAAAYGLSPESDDATFYSRRPRKFTPGETAAAKGALGGSGAGSSKYQRKLALFEGGARAEPPSRLQRSATAGGNIMGGGALLEADRQKHHVDANTPLLGDKDYSPPFDGYGEREDEAAARPGRSYSTGYLGSGSKPMVEKEKPYRFTFYSNALPSTIHARHLFEIPAPGQSFEDLLRGRVSKDEDQDVEDEEGKKGSKPGSQVAAHANASRVASLASNAGAPGRVEGLTAPPSRIGTPVMGDSSRMNLNASGPSGGISAARLAMTSSAGLPPSASAGGNGNGNGNGSNTAYSDATADANGHKTTPTAIPEKMLPGGGIRMDQDPEANTWWLDVLCPTDQEMKLISRTFGIHPLTTEDILMEETREKIELFRNYYLVCFRSFDQDPYSPTYLEPLNMYIIVFREGTISFHFRATPHPSNVRRRIKQLKDYINVTSDWISYALIDDITDAFGPLIQSIEYEVDSIDELVLILKEAEQSDMLRRIGTCRKKVMGLLRLMGNKADVVKGLAKRCNENWSVAPKSDIGLYLSDIQDHLITMTQNLNHYEKILSRSHSNYLAQISIEMTDANNQINDVLSKLTALGTVIVPLNIITGLWGMNVNVPGQTGGTPPGDLSWFGGIVGIMIFVAVAGYIATLRYLKR